MQNRLQEETLLKQLHNYLDRGAPEAGVETAEVVVTDGELLMQFVRHRDEAAFAEIVSRHDGMVWVVCREVLGHHQDVEDAFQATFLALAQRADRIRNCDSAAACLYKVAQRTAQAARRRQSQRREESCRSNRRKETTPRRSFTTGTSYTSCSKNSATCPRATNCRSSSGTSRATRDERLPSKPTRPSPKSKAAWCAADACCARAWRVAEPR